MMAPRGTIGRIALAVFFVSTALVLTLGLERITARPYFILFVPAVMFSAWFGGLAAGMLASALTVIATLLLLPRTELVDQLAWLIVAAIIAVAMSAVTNRRRQAETDLEAEALEQRSRRRDAEVLSDLKTEILVQVVHELRQPLNAMSGAVRLLETDADERTRQRAVSVMGRQTEHLRRLVEDLLDASRITRGEIQLRKSSFDLCEMAEDSLQIITADAAARGVDVASSVPDGPLHLVADPTRIRQVLSNLLSNAVKFTPKGGRIDLIVQEAPADVVIRVRDTGDGIVADHLPRVFEMFHKGDGEGAGLGIGLAVVKGLVELHGGSVDARSAGAGLGSEFVVTLPSGPAAGQPQLST